MEKTDEKQNKQKCVMHLYGWLRLAANKHNETIAFFDDLIGQVVDICVYKNKDESLIARFLYYNGSMYIPVTEYKHECGFYCVKNDLFKIVVEEDPLCGEDALLVNMRYIDHMAFKKLVNMM